MNQIDVRRSTVTLDPDPTHVLARPFRLMSEQRSVKITSRVMALSEDQVHTLLGGVRAEFADRQLKIDELLLRRFNEVRPYVLDGQRLSEERKLILIKAAIARAEESELARSSSQFFLNSFIEGRSNHVNRSKVPVHTHRSWGPDECRLVAESA